MANTDQSVTIEGSDGAYVEMTVGDALAAGLITEARAAELRDRDLFAAMFDMTAERFDGPVAGLPGAVSAEERARRSAEDDARVDAADGVSCERVR